MGNRKAGGNPKKNKRATAVKKRDNVILARMQKSDNQTGRPKEHGCYTVRIRPENVPEWAKR